MGSDTERIDITGRTVYVLTLDTHCEGESPLGVFVSAEAARVKAVAHAKERGLENDAWISRVGGGHWEMKGPSSDYVIRAERVQPHLVAESTPSMERGGFAERAFDHWSTPPLDKPVCTDPEWGDRQRLNALLSNRPAGVYLLDAACAEIEELRRALASLLELTIEHEVRIEGEWGMCNSRERMEQDRIWSDQIYQARKALNATDPPVACEEIEPPDHWNNRPPL